MSLKPSEPVWVNCYQHRQLATKLRNGEADLDRKERWPAVNDQLR